MTTSVPNEAVDLRRESLRIAIDRTPAQAEPETLIQTADHIASYLRDGIVPTSTEELADALHLVASWIEDKDGRKPIGKGATEVRAYTPNDLRDLAKSVER